MPSWKKVITSGSNAQLNQITASGFNLVGTGTAELEVDGHITASGNISASGIITAEGLVISDDATITDDLTVSGQIELGHASDTSLTRASSGDVNIEGNIIYRAGGTDVPVADGGTGASTLTNGGVLLGSGTSAITAMAVLTDGQMIVGDGSGDPVAESGATLRTSIGVGTGDNVQFTNITGTGNTVLGNATADTHTFTGHITASGNISSSDGNIITKKVLLDTGENNGFVFGTVGLNGKVADDGSNLIINYEDGDRFQVNGSRILFEVPLDISDATDATDASGDTGALKTEGGVSIAKKLFVGTDLFVTGSGNIYGSASALNFKNDTSNPSELRLHCEANSHYIGIRGPVHSGASSYVLKLPNSAPSDNQILKVDGSPSGGEVTLAWESDGGGGGGVSFPTTEVISSSADLIIGNIESNTYISASSGNLEMSGSGTGQLEVDHRLFDTGSTTLVSAGGGMGDIVKFGGSGTTAGDIYYLKPEGTWTQARANAGHTSTGSLAVALGSNSTTDGMLLKGMVKLDSDPSTGIGNPVFLDDTTAGHARSDAPGSGGDIVRIVGYYYGNSGLIYFNPDNTFIEVAS